MRGSSFLQNRLLRAIFQLIIALIGVLIFIWFLGPAHYQIDGFEVQGALRPTMHGRTVVELPPLGAFSAITHTAPVECRITLLRVEEKTVLTHLSDFSLSSLWSRIEDDAGRALRLFALRQLVLGILGALFFTWLFCRMPLRKIWQPAAAGLMITVVWLAPAYITFHTDGFKHPAYSGMIGAAPRILALSEDLVSGFEKFKADTPEVVANLQALFSRADGLNGLSDVGRGKRLLLVSDIHNNPVGQAFARELAARFAVDAVLDAGDLTDFGSPLELNIVEGLSENRVPYVFASGNHDSPAVTEFLASKPGVYVLKGGVINVTGLSILGCPDPSAYRSTVKAESTAIEEAEFRAQTDALKQVLKHRNKNSVDLLLVHDPKIASRFIGQIPLIVCGHTHVPVMEGDSSSLFLNPGTTGAAGIRGLQYGKEVPYTAMVVYLDTAERPSAVDIITYGPREGNFRVERQAVPQAKPSVYNAS
ncbi:MAG: metallophosphoesterase family protein [Bacillota bacterium]